MPREGCGWWETAGDPETDVKKRITAPHGAREEFGVTLNYLTVRGHLRPPISKDRQTGRQIDRQTDRWQIDR